jgi:hypothetical protein
MYIAPAVRSRPIASRRTCAARAARAASGLLLAGCAGSARREAPPVPTAPERFAPGVISDAREQWRITFTPDGATAYFAASDGFFPLTRQATIYVSHRRGGGWSRPEVAPFSGTYSDIDPVIAPDGRRLYFASIRPVGGATRGDVDLWMVERTGAAWGPPVRLGPEVNTPRDELYPSVSGDGSLFFASGPRAPAPGEHFDIFRAAARGAGFAPSERLGPGVNRQPQAGDPHPQAAWEFNPEISADGQTLLFTSLRPGGYGLGDLYASQLRDGDWSPARNLGPAVNSAADEFHPTRSRDGEWLYFVRRQPLPGDFYRVPARLLPALQPLSSQLPASRPPAAAQPIAPTGLLDALRRAGEAQQQGDPAEVRRLLRAAYGFGPDNGQVIYFLAREEARAGNADSALALLDRLAAQGIARDARADTGFAPVQAGATRARFAATAERLLTAAAPLVRSDTSHVMRDPDFIPEGIAYDGVDDVFYVGSLHRRSVVRVDRRRRETTFIDPGREGLGQVLGLRVDEPRRRLWLATLALDSAAPRHSNGGGGWAFLHAYELPSGRLVARHAAPDSAVPHLLNDLVVTPAGDLYVSDTEAHAVYRLPAGGRRLEQVHGGQETFRYPNGIALDPSGRRLYVAHFEGISVGEVGPAAGARLTPMPRPPGVSGGGIDGLYACADQLVAVQGLFGFQQVTAFRLAPDGRAITAAEPLERRHPIYDWATTGALANGDFHYIANAQLRRLSPTGALSAPATPGSSVVLRLPNVCGGR